MPHRRGSSLRPAPCLGEHNQAAFVGLLGLSQAEYQHLEAEGDLLLNAAALAQGAGTQIQNQINWVPINIGSDAALALSMCQVIVRERLYRADFVREQTDMPLLLVESTRRFLREKDLERGGREDIFHVYDEASGRVVEAPHKSLALGDIVPALDSSV
ncbi:MAG: molybdopterin-dependent oxidoreductase [Chloroflexi bacterium]|nr:molybdopterin-dependent oxidoreductase [Chloroflexota bacterium]